MKLSIKLVCALALLASAHWVWPAFGQDADELAAILWDEVIQVAAAGRVTDLSFETTGLNVIHPNEMVWVADPTSTGIVAVASRPILGTAKAAETLGRRGDEVLKRTLALEVGSQQTLALQEGGQLVILRSGWVDTLTVGVGRVQVADVDRSLSGLLYVLWGSEIRVYADPPAEPLWTFSVEADLAPAVGFSVSSGGEVVVAGRGSVAVAVYDLDSNGEYARTRSLSAENLETASVDGMVLSPSMLLPVEGREGWVDGDRFILIADAESGSLVALERSTLQVVGRIDLRDEIPAAAPGRIDISNRGQIAYVDKQSTAGYVLPTRMTVAVLGDAKFRWRRVDQDGTFRSQRDKPDSTTATSKDTDG